MVVKILLRVDIWKLESEEMAFMIFALIDYFL